MGLWLTLKKFIGVPERHEQSSEWAGHGSTPHAQPSAPSAPSLHDVIQADGYTLIDRIGAGGSGEVWVARNELGGYRAVKVIDFTAYGGELAKMEVAALLRLEHLSRRTPALIGIQHIRCYAGFLYYTMPLADNAVSEDGSYNADYESLSVEWLISHEGRRPVSECVGIALRVLDGLDALHAKKLRHGDVKPSNIVRVDREFVLADIGLVTIATSQTGSGSQEYVPPEGTGQPSADHYALGKSVYRMASGLPVESCSAPPAGDVDPLYSRLNRVIIIACNEDPAKRYANAKVFRTALLKVLEPQVTGEPKSTRRRWLWRRRKFGSDTPAKTMFKNRINVLIDEAAAKWMTTATPPRDCLLSGEFEMIADEVSQEFERRMGYQPVEVKAACDFLKVIVEPDEAEQQEMMKNLVEPLCRFKAAINVFDVMSDVWGLGRLVVGGVWASCRGLLGLLGLWKKSPAERTRDALDGFKKGMQTAIDSVWEPHKDELVAR